MSRGFDIFIEEALRYRRYYENPLELGRAVAAIARRRVPDARVYIFGSTARGRYTGGSDIDVLIVTPARLGREAADGLRARIVLEVDAPAEVHIASAEEFERWYRRFVREEELIEIS